MTVFTPCALSIRMTASPIGPQPITTAVSPLPTLPRRTACHATASGSVMAAASALTLSGTGKVSDSWTTTFSAYPPGAFAARPVMPATPSVRTIGSATTNCPFFQCFRVFGPYSRTRPLNS